MAEPVATLPNTPDAADLRWWSLSPHTLTLAPLPNSISAVSLRDSERVNLVSAVSVLTAVTSFLIHTLTLLLVPQAVCVSVYMCGIVSPALLSPFPALLSLLHSLLPSLLHYRDRKSGVGRARGKRCKRLRVCLCLCLCLCFKLASCVCV